MAFFTVITYAQKDVTTFLGIPIDGYKSEMTQKLISKGFVPKKLGDNEFLDGEFNGEDVHIYIGTNNNKVYRIMLCDANTRSEADIKIRFNKLVSQFKNNKRYLSLGDYTLSEFEDISYEMRINKKNYDAYFLQIPDMDMLQLDTLAIGEQFRNEFLKKYTPEQLEKPSEEMTQDLKSIAQSIATRVSADIMLKKPVWFRICKSFDDEYYIAMFYDNEYNKPNGEDL
jgi:hypothetical protein